jgi:hypothetical protein
MKKFGQNHFEIWIDIFVFEFWKKKLVIENGKIEKKNRFWNLDWNLKKWNMSQKFEMKKLKIFIFKIWIFILKFKMKTV